MPPKRNLRKTIDIESEVRCVAGKGLIREEVWEDEHGNVIRYNLAFINHFTMKSDNGRVLGYDASHGYHHRHFKGMVTPFPFVSYKATLDRFILEVWELRKETT